MSTAESTASPLARDGAISVRLCRSKYELRSRLSCHPAVYLPLARRKYAGNVGKVVEHDRTQVVIDGFQRSANTFSVTAFQFAQPEPVNVAHHLHAAAQIAAAVRWRIPTMVLIREPDGAIISHMIRFPCVTPEQAIRNWSRFYEAVRAVRDGVVVADFEEVTGDFGVSIRRLNERFGTAFTPFDHTEGNVQRCFELIDRRNAGRFGTVEDHTVARPSAARERKKDTARSAFMDPRLEGRRARVRALYDDLVTGG